MPRDRLALWLYSVAMSLRFACLVLATVCTAMLSHADIVTPSTPLHLASVQAAVADLESGQLLYSKNADRQVPIASVTKLMTALLVLESGQPLDEWLEIRKREGPTPANGYSRIRIGSELRRDDLLRIMLMASENLAAYQLAAHHPGGHAAFIAAMNRRAVELGMHDTRFVDSSGLSAENRSTAVDLLQLARATLAHDRIREYSLTPGFSAAFRKPNYALQYGNTNPLVHNASWDVELTKTGFLNAAGRCLVMVANIEGRSIAMVVLDSEGSRTPIGDAGRINRWLRTGQSGNITAAARYYEQQRNLAYSTGNSAGLDCTASAHRTSEGC
jgi:serine-type D-Ala-D-Ala endopeptidase (penicillin-binding protein 7)